MLTKKQMDLLQFIHARVQRDGVPPSFDEMKDALDLRSKSGIHRLITALEERGYIRRLAHKARALEIIKLPDNMMAAEGPQGFVPRVIEGDRPTATPLETAPVKIAATELPVMGKIAAGVPIAAISEVSHTVAVPGSMVGRGNHYALEVKGDSMINAGINEGDVVVIRETSSVENGDIVVAVVEGYEATLKRFRRKGGMIALEAANPAFETRLVPESEVEVQGKLVGLIRNYI